jgi:hypothetical protein
MRLLFKLVLLGVVTILFMFCSGNPGIRNKGISTPLSSEMKNSHKDVNITNTRTYKDRSDDPVVTVETMVRGMRNNNPLPDPEEIRQQRNLARSANVEWIKESTKEYSPDSWYLLMQYENLPLMTEASTADDGIITTQKAAETFHYLRGRTRLDLLASMETNVHEIAHAYFDQNVFRYVRENNLSMTWDNVYGYIYISPSKGFYITYPRKSMFPSHELTEVISTDLRTYRFETYINGSTSTQSEGVIGLLNELNAYYNGSRYCFDMLEPYKTAAGSEAAGLFEWVTRTQSSMSAFYELDFFIREYLLYMKKNYAANYEKLKLYRPFTEAYMTIYTLYKELIDNYQERIRDEVKLLNSSGNTEAKTEKGWLWVRAENSNVSSGAPIFSEYRETLLTVLESRRYREIEGDFIAK